MSKRKKTPENMIVYVWESVCASEKSSSVSESNTRKSLHLQKWKNVNTEKKHTECFFVLNLCLKFTLFAGSMTSSWVIFLFLKNNNIKFKREKWKFCEVKLWIIFTQQEIVSIHVQDFSINSYSFHQSRQQQTIVLWIHYLL
jgi:hypothetical protein